MTLPRIIAIDGPAASGKSTLGCKLAEYLGYLFFDTGIMYRAVTWAAIQQGLNLDDETAITALAERIQIDVLPPSLGDGRDYDVLVDGEDVTWPIRKVEIDANVSQVSAYRGVRLAMTQQQRRIGSRGKVVMVGRDIGTVVLPEADLKIFLTASASERARRRYEELLARGEPESYEQILEGLRRRDQIDSNREVAPLRKAEDAITIDSDGLTIDQVFEKARALTE
ncbi:MAG: (d)CMP kinase [Chloroflexi bacterium]|nr:(d)CMP kinase [Chloroflexota bacterium]